MLANDLRSVNITGGGSRFVRFLWGWVVTVVTVLAVHIPILLHNHGQHKDHDALHNGQDDEHNPPLPFVPVGAAL